MTVLSSVDETAPDSSDAPFSPPYRDDAGLELPLVELTPKAKAVLEAHVHNMHQQELMRLVAKVSWCPQPLPFLLQPTCPPSDSELVKSQRIHAVLQLLSQLREEQYQALLRCIYKNFGSDHRRAARELYAREFFSTAYLQYYTLYTCLSCDKCRLLHPSDHHNITVDLLGKLAITSLRAGWLADAARFATEALALERSSMRARIWLATAQLGLGDLPAARTHLAALPPRGAFPPHLPPWLERRVQAQRAVLARLEHEAAGSYDLAALARDAPSAPPAGPHFTALLAAQPAGAGGALRTRAPVARGAVLLVAHPAACVPCLTAPAPAARVPRTAHAEDPALLALARLADALFSQAQALEAVRAPLLAGGARADAALAGLVGNSLRAAAIHVAQTYSVAVPHAPGGGGGGGGGGAPAKPRTAHGGHAVYLPLLDLRCASGAANTYATFCGPHLFLRAACDLDEGVVLAFDGFDHKGGHVTAPEAATPKAAAAPKAQ